MTKNVQVNYYTGSRFTHSYGEKWEKIDLYCPKCGKKEVWHDTGPGDIDVDEQHLCTSCSHSFYLPGGVSDTCGHDADEQRLSALRADSTP